MSAVNDFQILSSHSHIKQFFPWDLPNYSSPKKLYPCSKNYLLYCLSRLIFTLNENQQKRQLFKGWWIESQKNIFYFAELNPHWIMDRSGSIKVKSLSAYKTPPPFLSFTKNGQFWSWLSGANTIHLDHISHVKKHVLSFYLLSRHYGFLWLTHLCKLTFADIRDKGQHYANSVCLKRDS